jgi:PBP1b-binding outer membrane lipoprotein LpoB
MKKRIALILLIAVFLAGCSAGGWTIKQDRLAETVEGLAAANLGYYVGWKTDFAPVAVEYAVSIREIVKTGDPNLVVKALIEKGMIELAKRTNNDPYVAMNMTELVSLLEFKPVDGATWTNAEKLALYDKLIAKFLMGIEFGKLKRTTG